MNFFNLLNYIKFYIISLLINFSKYFFYLIDKMHGKDVCYCLDYAELIWINKVGWLVSD